MGIAKKGGYCLKANYFDLSELNIKFFIKHSRSVAGKLSEYVFLVNFGLTDPNFMPFLGWGGGGGGRIFWNSLGLHSRQFPGNHQTPFSPIRALLEAMANGRVSGTFMSLERFSGGLLISKAPALI